jgi:hypothetical protein
VLGFDPLHAVDPVLSDRTFAQYALRSFHVLIASLSSDGMNTEARSPGNH